MKNNYQIQEDSVDRLSRRGPPEVTKAHTTEFVSALTHEIRNPLTNINLAAEMLQSMASNDDQKMILDVIIRNSGRINDLLIDLLASFSADEMQPEKQSIHQLLDKVLFMCKDRIMLKNITVRKDYGLQDCKIVLNEPKMKIALTNIIINAIESMARKGGQLKILTKSIADKFIIQIEDNGCGIGGSNLKNIFKPHFTNKPGGLGVGLAVTYDILRLNHVRVNVRSEVGKGTCFILLFEKHYQETHQQDRTNTMPSFSKH